MFRSVKEVGIALPASAKLFLDGILWLARQINRLLGNTWTICKSTKIFIALVKMRLVDQGFLPPWAIHLLSNRFLDTCCGFGFLRCFPRSSNSKWIIFNHLLLLSEDSDMAFLHYQERKLRNKPNSAETWSNAYYMPGTSNQPVTNLQPVVFPPKKPCKGESDRSIGAWRQWLAKVRALIT